MSLAKSFPSPSELPAESGTTPRLFRFKPENDEAGRIYEALADHQVREEWDYKAFITELQRWAGIFDRAFGLGVPEVSLGIDRLRRNRLGQFCEGHNAFGLKGEVLLNDRYLHDVREPWQVLGTLLHELLHGWQQAYGRTGKNNYHNKQFREKALHYGLVVDDRGRTQYDSGGRFFALLREHGRELPELPTQAPFIRERGESKLKKWSCGCTNARVAVSDFRARCLRCGREFLRCD